MIKLNIKTKFMLTFSCSILITICSILVIFWLLLCLITGEISSPSSLYKIMAEQKQISTTEQKALIYFREKAKNNPDQLLNNKDKKMIKNIEQKDIQITIRKDDDILYYSPKLTKKSILAHAPNFDTSNIYTQGTIDNQGRLFRYIKFDYYFSDNEPGSIMIMKQENNFIEFLKQWGFFIVFFIILLSTLLVFLLNKMLKNTVFSPISELSRNVSNLKKGDFNGTPLPNNLKKGEIYDLLISFEQLRIQLLKSNIENQKFEKNRKELISNISHDLRTPITSIIGYIEALNDGIANTPSKRSKYINIIYNKSLTLNSLIDDLFLYSKLDLQKETFNFKKINYIDFMEQYFEETSYDLEHQNIKMIKDFDNLTEAQVLIDINQIRRVFDNILQNSIKYMDKNPKVIHFNLKIENNEIITIITDNGVGVDGDQLSFIFERFTRIEESRNTPGNGLGLAISKSIITEHKGTISAKTPEVFERGLRIIITLPLRSEEYE